MPAMLSKDDRRAQRCPRISLSVSDHRRLQILALGALLSDPRNAGALLDEIDRADVVEDSSIDRQIVGLGDVVEFRDNHTAERRVVRLVADVDDDADAATISALSACGAALLGLCVGQSILWSDRLGEERSYTVLDVRSGRTDGDAP